MQAPTLCRIALLVIGVICLLALSACLGPQWKRDPDVQAAQTICSGQPEGERYTCIESEAIARHNPEVCRLAGIYIDDACLQALYEAANDPAICDRIYLEGVVPNCLAWYSEPTPGVGLGQRWRPEAESMAGCAPVTARDIADFVDALAGEEHAFSHLCERLGRPDWETGGGLIIYIYQLDDGSEIWMGFGRLVNLVYAVQIAGGGQHLDLLSGQ